MPEQLREPFARRGETWDRAEQTAAKAADIAADGEHPEMLALIRTQHREVTALIAVQANERIRLALQLRDSTT